MYSYLNQTVFKVPRVANIKLAFTDLFFHNLTHPFFISNTFIKQHQAEIGKKSSKS